MLLVASLMRVVCCSLFGVRAVVVVFCRCVLFLFTVCSLFLIVRCWLLVVCRLLCDAHLLSADCCFLCAVVVRALVGVCCL